MMSSGGASSSHAGGNPFTRHGRLVISAAADPKNLDPIIDSSQPTLELSMFLFSYTIRYDEHSQPVPDAVSEVPTLENGDVSLSRAWLSAAPSRRSVTVGLATRRRSPYSSMR